MSGTAPKTGALQQSSLPWWPLAKKPLRKVSLGLFKQEVQLPGCGVSIQLFVPARLLKCAEPLGKPLVFFRGQAADGRLKLLNPIHTWSLAPPGPAASPHSIVFRDRELRQRRLAGGGIFMLGFRPA
jgi:hypothetical protein